MEIFNLSTVWSFLSFSRRRKASGLMPFFSNTITPYQSFTGMPVGIYKYIPPAYNDNDGMADDWEIAHGMNPNIDDSALDIELDGYTNIEQYLYDLSTKGLPPS